MLHDVSEIETVGLPSLRSVRKKRVYEEAVRREPRRPAASTAGDHANQNRKDRLAVRPRSNQPNRKPDGSSNGEGRKIESRGMERETVLREKRRKLRSKEGDRKKREGRRRENKMNREPLPLSKFCYYG